MLTSHSIETMVATISAEHKVSASAVAALDGGISSATLNKAASGQGKLSPEKEQSLRETLEAIYSIINQYRELPIDFNRVSKIKPLVDQRKKELRDRMWPDPFRGDVSYPHPARMRRSSWRYPALGVKPPGEGTTGLRRRAYFKSR
jgi:hypothetical protein